MARVCVCVCVCVCQFRLIVKMAVKLLVVFVEYNESNTLLLLQAIDKVDSKQGATFLTLTCITFIHPITFCVY